MGRSSSDEQHSFSQSFEVGHKTPQAPPMILFSFMVRMAPFIFLSLNFLINFPGSVLAGHPLEQGASWHSRHLSASAAAWL